ncbi:MAG: translocation/assembly module TamB domain-containing protein [Gammaproteobacteria bacterium]
MRLVTGVAASVLLVLAAGAALLAWIAGTTSGSAWAVRTALAAAGPGISVGGVRGRLADALAITGLRVERDGLTLAVGEAELAWQVAALWRGELHVSRLAARDVRVEPPPADPAATPAGLPAYPALPLVVVVDEALVERLVIVQDGHETALGRVAFSARVDTERATLESLAVESADFTVAGRAGVAAGDILAVSADLAVDLPRQASPVSLTLGLAGRLDAVHVEVRASGPASLRLAGDVDVLATPPTFTVDGKVEPYVLDVASGDRIGPTALHLAGSPLALDFELAAPLTLAALGTRQLNVEGHARSADGAAWRGTLTWRAQADDDTPWPLPGGTADIDYADDTLVVAHQGTAPFTSTLDLRVTALASVPRIDLTLDVGAIAWPPALPQVELGQATLGAHGTPEALDLDLAGDGTLPGRGPFALAARARFAGERLDIDSLHADLFDGVFDLHGTVGLGATLGAVLDITAAGLDLARADPRLAGRLGFHGALDGRLVDGEPAGRLVLDDVHGDWRGHRLEARAELARQDGVIAIHDLDAAVGDNAVTADLSLGTRLAGRFDLAARDLAQFDPALGGTIDGHGSLGGRVEAPAVTVELDGRKLRYDTLRIAALTVDAALDLATSEAQHVTLTASGLARARERFGDLDLVFDGSPGAHTLAARLVGGERTVTLDARGGWADGAWRGTVEQLALGLGSFGAWALAAPAALAYADAAISLKRACLASGTAEICAAAPRVEASNARADIALKAIPLDLFADYLPTTVALSGTVAGRAEYTRADGVDRATAALAVSDGAVRLSLADGTVETLPIPSLTADLDLDGPRLDIATAGSVGDWVTLDGALGLVDGSVLDGRLDLLAARLDWLEEFVPDVAGSRGRLRLQARVGGTVAAPLLDSRLHLEEGALLVQATGMRVTDLDLAVASRDGRRFTLAGKLGNDDGTLGLDGSIERAPADDWRARLAVRGDHLAAVRLPDVEADVSPDLEFLYGDGLADIRGSITLPRVHVAVRHLPDSAVEVSGDEIVVGEGDGDDAPRENFFVDNVTGDVEAIIGDDVRISAAGLEARLGGGLRWTKARGDGIGRGEGRVSIVDGGYQAYGQQLTIERGHLTFAGPIDNPALDVRAVRPDLDIVAGLLVSGDVRAPRFDLFSEPPLPDAEVLSYVITGEGLSEASSGEGKLIARAALSLGAERSSMITSQVADAFGLDDLSVNTGTTARETSFTAGKRIGPKLAVRSEFNPFDRLWSVFLNYKLTQNWAVEAESGVRQGGDVIYSIEREDTLFDRVFSPARWFDDD